MDDRLMYTSNSMQLNYPFGKSNLLFVKKFSTWWFVTKANQDFINVPKVFKLTNVYI